MINNLLTQSKIEQAIPLILANKPACRNCKRLLVDSDIWRDIKDHFDTYSIQFYSESAGTLCNACYQQMIAANSYIDELEDLTL